MKKNYFDQIIIDIEQQINKNQWQIAFDMLQQELNLPYIPSNIEKKLNQLLCKITPFLGIDSEKISKKHLQYNDDFVIEQLNSNNHNHIDFEIIFLLENMNLRKYLTQIQQFLANSNKDPYIKSFLMDILKKQEINQNFVLNKNHKKYTINPSKHITCIQQSFFINIKKNIQSHLLENNPAMCEICLEIWRWFNYYLYPDKPLNSQLIQAWTITIVYYVLKLQNQVIDLNQLCQEYKVKESDVRPLILELQKLKGTQNDN